MKPNFDSFGRVVPIGGDASNIDLNNNFNLPDGTTTEGQGDNSATESSSEQKGIKDEEDSRNSIADQDEIKKQEDG